MSKGKSFIRSAKFIREREGVSAFRTWKRYLGQRFAHFLRSSHVRAKKPKLRRLALFTKC